MESKFIQQGIDIDKLISDLRETREPLSVAVLRLFGRRLSGLPRGEAEALLKTVGEQLKQCDNCGYWRSASSIQPYKGRMLCSTCRALG